MTEFLDPAAMWQLLRTNPVAGVIVAGEIAFWIVLAAGLTARYLLRSPRLGAGFLLGVPLIDVVVLIAAFIHLYRGATADATHGLAAIYLGFSVAFGPAMVRWADQRFAHRFAGGPPPVKPPKHGPERIRYEWAQWGKMMICWAITCGTVLLFVVCFGDRAAALHRWAYQVSLISLIWFVVGPLWVTIFPPKKVGERA